MLLRPWGRPLSREVIRKTTSGALKPRRRLTVAALVRAFTVTRGTDITAAAIKFSAMARAHPSHGSLKLHWRMATKRKQPMNHISMRSERRILVNPTDRRVAQKAIAWDRIIATLTEPDLIAIVMFCAIGCLVTFALARTFPSFGQIAESLQQFL